MTNFYGKIDGYMVACRSKDKNTTQGNLAELAGSPVAPAWCKQPSLLRVVHSLFIAIICAGNEENALIAGAFDECRDSRKA